MSEILRKKSRISTPLGIDFVLEYHYIRRMSVDIDSIQIDQSRKEVLKDEFQKPYFSQIKEFLTQERNNGKIIFPK